MPILLLPPQNWGCTSCHGCFLDSGRYIQNIATPPKESADKDASGNNLWFGLEKISCCLGVTSEHNGFLLRFTTQCLQQGCYCCPAAWLGAPSLSSPKTSGPYQSTPQGSLSTLQSPSKVKAPPRQHPQPLQKEFKSSSSSVFLLQGDSAGFLGSLLIPGSRIRVCEVSGSHPSA